jgi:hypothetical protein
MTAVRGSIHLTNSEAAFGEVRLIALAHGFQDAIKVPGA